ncbi:hypothetical protein H072_1570 [Dactylellina haptotyla CBS 200.50]|uniref:Uncharacterized protein n=1 Tax=Dactylellina haptotyla (strain CBS 200.50) TaxID=1284197 RepID=S8AU12_DACHA|nr:hypothetical protein H072_1570 [Dactylellina haptotyla CBS 200.50]
MPVSKDLGIILESQERANQDSDRLRTAINDMKLALSFQSSLEEILRPAPVAISCMAACSVATSSRIASMSLSAPGPNLRHDRLQPNLVEVNSSGRFPFIELTKGIGTIAQVSKMINNKFGNVLESVFDEMAAKQILRHEFDGIKASVSQSVEISVKVDQKFEEWLIFVRDLHAACVQEQGDDHDRLQKDQIQTAVERSLLNTRAQPAEQGKNVANLLGDQIKFAEETFKKLSDEFPTGWTFLGQQIVADLVTAVASAFVQAIPVLVDNSFPLKNPSSGAAVFNARDTFPLNHADPAYTEVIKLTTILATLKVICNATDGSVDWVKAKGDGEKSTIGFLQAVLQFHKEGFGKFATNAEPSATLNSILDDCLQVANDISNEITNGSKPDKDSDVVKRVQAKFASAYDKANTLAATARAVPGAPPGGVVFMSATDSRGDNSNVDANSTQAQATYESANNQLRVVGLARSAYGTDFGRFTDLIDQQQNKLGEIRANASRATERGSEISLNEIRQLLVDTIKIILSLKQETLKFCRSFQAIMIILDTFVRFQVKPYVETLNQGDHQQQKVGEYSVADFQRAQIIGTTAVIQAQLGLLADISNNWNKMANDSLMPGLSMSDQLSSMVGSDGRMLISMGQKIRQKTQSAMETRLEDVQKVIGSISPPSDGTLAAITAGVEISKVTAQKGIEQRVANSPLQKFT